MKDAQCRACFKVIVFFHKGRFCMKHKLLLVVFFFQCWVAQQVLAQQAMSHFQQTNKCSHTLESKCSTSIAPFEFNKAGLVPKPFLFCLKPFVNRLADNHWHLECVGKGKPTLIFQGDNDFYSIDSTSPFQTFRKVDETYRQEDFLKNDFVQWLLNSDEDMDTNSAKVTITQLTKLAKKINAGSSNKNMPDNYESYLDYLDRCNLVMTQNAIAATNTN